MASDCRLRATRYGETSMKLEGGIGVEAPLLLRVAVEAGLTYEIRVVFIRGVSTTRDFELTLTLR